VKWIWLVAIAAILVGLLIPVELIEAPEWEVKVVDESGNGISGVTVREAYKDYSAEAIGSERDLISNEQGIVIFPLKKVRNSGLKRLVARVSSLNAGVHASFGRHAYVFAFGKCEGDSVKNGYVEDWTGGSSHNRSTIICRQMKGN
jgi:hypothetical protein